MKSLTVSEICRISAKKHDKNRKKCTVKNFSQYFFFLFLIIRDASQIVLHGGSDKSGIFKIFFENPTAQRKIIRFYKTKKKLTGGYNENQDIQ
jgi:hypothetical protein